jgi:hypothetical protein
MKNSLLLLAIAICAISFTSCNSYKSIRTAKNVRQLSANPFTQKVARSVLTNISEDVIGKGLTSFKGKPLFKSSLGSLFNTSQSVSTFKNMVSNTYGISKDKVETNYKSWGTVRDVISFVARNGQRFDFNSYSNKLF